MTDAGAQKAFQGYAKLAGLQMGAFQTCVRDRATHGVVNDQMAAGDQVRVPGTPGVFLNGVRLMDYADEQEFQAVLAITTAKPSALDVIRQRVEEFRPR